MVFFMFNDLRWEMAIHFVDIGGIVDISLFQKKNS